MSLGTFSHWFCSVDVCKSRYLVAAGRNHGILRLMSTEGRQVIVDHKVGVKII